MNEHPVLFDREEVSRKWRWFLLLGILLVVLGVVALAAVWLTNSTSVRIFGALLIVGGLCEIVAAFWARHSSALLLRVLMGILYVVVGVVLTGYPAVSAAALTMLLVWLFVACGVVRTVTAAILRYPAWEWSILESIGALILGLLIWSNWPDFARWLIGLFVGMGMMLRGWAWVMFAFGARHIQLEDGLFGPARLAQKGQSHW